MIPARRPIAVFRELVFILLPAILLGACAMSQEGAVDFRKATLSDQAGRQDKIDEADGKDGKENHPPFAPARLVSKFIAAPEKKHAVIQEGDSITIRLSQAFIKDFWELGFFSPHRGFRSNGEIAIVVHAFEYHPNDKSKDFNFGPEGLRQGRLVFFSSDVEENQPLNLANMPIYGPITYNGNPVGLQISILEIDANTEQVKALLTSLASAGANAYPPSSPILSLLDKLGTALLEGGTDDTEFRFTFVLDPPTAYTGLAYPRVEAGNYVFVRESDRQANTPWDELVLDENTGRLYWKADSAPLGAVPADGSQTAAGTDRQYRANTYVTLQINKGFDSTGIDLSENTFGQFIDQLQQIDTKKAENLKPVLTEIENLAYARVQRRNFIEARNKLTEFIQAKQEEEVGPARRAAFDLYTMLADAMEKLKPTADGTSNPKANEASLSASDVELLLNRLRSIADARTSAQQQQFTIAGFSTAFPKDDPVGFENFFAAIHRKNAS